MYIFLWFTEVDAICITLLTIIITEYISFFGIVNINLSVIYSQLYTYTISVLTVYLTLLKVMVPALLIVKILTILGVTVWFGAVLSPFMQLVGLPDELAIVWATTMLTNLYTGMVVLYDVSQGTSISVAQISVLSIMMLLAHALPVEGAVAKMIGVSWRVTIPLRIMGGFIFGMILHQGYTLTGLQQGPAEFIWQPDHVSGDMSDWLFSQLLMLVSILFIIAALMLLLSLFKWCGIDRLIELIMSPFLKVLTIGSNATHVCIIGLILGLSFGAGLLIEESRKGSITRRDIMLSVCFLCLAHSLIEDTLLILLLGPDIMVVLWGRLLFAFIVTAILARLLTDESGHSDQQRKNLTQ